MASAAASASADSFSSSDSAPSKPHKMLAGNSASPISSSSYAQSMAQSFSNNPVPQVPIRPPLLLRTATQAREKHLQHPSHMRDAPCGRPERLNDIMRVAIGGIGAIFS